MHQYKSACERKAAPKIMHLGGTYCESFAPMLSPTYYDAANAELTGKPDFLIHRGGGYTNIEMKDSILNNHRTQGESTAALRRAYGDVFGRYGDHLQQSALTSALYSQGQRGQILERENAWHNSLWKVLALQAQHGYQRYLVVFLSNPTGRDAARYCDAGLVFCTIKTLPDFLRCIELMRHGIYVPFQFSGKNYSFTVTPDLSSKGLSNADVTLIDRGRYIAAVASDRATEAASRAAHAADLAADILPF